MKETERMPSFTTLLIIILVSSIFTSCVENQKSITNSWQQRVWEAEMFSDPDLIRFFEEEGIIFTNWIEVMKRFSKS